MSKAIRLSWGFSVCKFKVPCLHLDPKCELKSCRTLQSRVNNQVIISPKERSKLNSKLSPCSHFPAAINDEVELAVVLPQDLVSKCSLQSPFIVGSDTRRRLFVYFVTLALSLAALSILKLHELLEWLLADTKTSLLNDTILDIKNKSVLITEILKTVALRFNSPVEPFELETCATSTTNLSSQPPTNPIPFPCTEQKTSTQRPSYSADNCACGLCISRSASEQCLICHLASEEYLSEFSKINNRHLYQNESSTKNVAAQYSWPPVCRPNAGICRGQVSVNRFSDHDQRVSVDVCSPVSFYLSGLDFAAEVSKSSQSEKNVYLKKFEQNSCKTKSDKHNRLDRSPTVTKNQTCHNEKTINGSSVISTRYSNGSLKLVACVAPTSQQRKIPTAQSSNYEATIARQNYFTCSKLIKKFPNEPSLLQTVEEDVVNDLKHSELALFSSTVSPGQVLSSSSALILARAAVSLATRHKTFRNKCVGVKPDCCEFGTSPVHKSNIDGNNAENDLNSQSDVESETGSLELDNDGVWFCSDYLSSNYQMDDDDYGGFNPSKIIHSKNCPNSPLLCEESWDSQFIINQCDNLSLSFIGSPTISDFMSTNNEKKKPTRVSESLPNALQCQEKFSDLFALTNTISSELVLLESGCKDLICRVQANQIDLDCVKDSLGFVWETKDTFDELDEDAKSVDIYNSQSSLRFNTNTQFISSPHMEESFTSLMSRSMIRYTPLGRSFISESNDGQFMKELCCCNCHAINQLSMHHSIASPNMFEDNSKNVSLDIKPLSTENFAFPEISFEDDDAVHWCDAMKVIGLRQNINSAT